jgi:hypothetical protein
MSLDVLVKRKFVAVKNEIELRLFARIARKYDLNHITFRVELAYVSRCLAR